MKRFSSNLILPLTLISLLIISISFSLLHKDSISALDSDFSNGITIDSTLDTPDANIGDGICDDGSGNCTLRAAIQEANSDPDASTILFNISGTPDFTNNSQDGYTIKPQSALPEITEQLTINGYSQPGASPNTAPAPQPLNGTLLIEVDGEDTASGDGFGVRGNNTTIKGLSIVGFSDHNAIGNAADGLTVQGNYIGVDHTGMAAKANACGLCQLADGSEDALIGGLDAEDRNIISGNTGTASSPNTNSHHWVYQGNYIGVGANGLTAIPNAQPGGAGSLSLDNSNDHVVGGPEPTAINVISGNLGHGIAPHNSDNLLIQGNYIGVGYDGVTPVPNGTVGSGGAGIMLGQVIEATIKGNIISNNPGGLYFNECHDIIIQGNTIKNSQTSGISIGPDSYNILIGGTSSADSNDISENAEQGIESRFTPYDHRIFSIIGNSIHDNGGLGIALSYSSPLANDALDSDDGPNDLLNSPRWTDMEEVGGNTTVQYQLDVPAGDYRIEFFSNTTADPSGHGEGETYLGFQNITSVGAGTQTFSHTLTGTAGVTNLAMTTTEIDASTPSGFGATSEFGDHLPIADISITNTLTNPQDVTPGATLNYALTYTNNGPDELDLTQFGFGGSTPLFYYIVHPDLIAADLGGSGPFPGSYFISDTGNPDITCIWGEGIYGAVSGAATHTDYGLILCYYTGSLADLAAGDSLNLDFNFTLSSDSSLNFATYALVPPTNEDPDYAIISQLLAQDPDSVNLAIGHPEINNFATAVFPIPQDLEESPPTDSVSKTVASTGQSVLIPSLMATMLIAVGMGITIKLKHTK